MDIKDVDVGKWKLVCDNNTNNLKYIIINGEYNE